jgi:GT2 family glycosyltransferase
MLNSNQIEKNSNRIVSVIVVTCDFRDYLRSCLDSIIQQTYKSFKIIVIDNSNDPNFNQQISKCYPSVKLSSNPNNLFYCQSLNKGIEMSDGDFILCLNDDVILDKRFIEEALRGFNFGGKIGMVSGKILRSDGKTLDSTGLFLSLWRTTKERGYGLKDLRQFEKEGYVFGVNGAVAFYRREMLETIKVDSDYFDADYHIFYEDLDIAWRAQSYGWKAYYVPKAVAYHVRGATVRLSSGIGKPYARRYLTDKLHLDLIKNRYLTIIKNESYPSFLLHLVFIFFYDIFVWSYILFFKPNIIKKFFLNLKFLKSALKKRKLIKKLIYSF